MLHADILISPTTSIIISILFSKKKIHGDYPSSSTFRLHRGHSSIWKIILLYKGVQSMYIPWTKEDITIKLNSQVVNYFGEQAKAMSELMLNSWQIQ